MKTIAPDSLVTLHLRVAHAASGTVMFSTFEGTPVTMQLGSGELMQVIEQRIQGLSEGAHETFTFAPGEAFGAYQESLIERVARSSVPADMELAVDSVFAFPAPDGSRYPGLVRELGDDYALVDFNHPLAGRAVSVEVRIIGVL